MFPGMGVVSKFWGLVKPWSIGTNLAVASQTLVARAVAGGDDNRARKVGGEGVGSGDGEKEGQGYLWVESLENWRSDCQEQGK